jgi:hypothetical protein
VKKLLSKSPRIFAADLHAVIFGALAESVGQNLKISLGSSAGKMSRPPSKLKRAGDIRLSSSISSLALAKIDEINAKLNADEERQKVPLLVSPQVFAPHLHAVVAEALAISAGLNLKISLGSVGKRKDHYRS